MKTITFDEWINYEPVTNAAGDLLDHAPHELPDDTRRVWTLIGSAGDAQIYSGLHVVDALTHYVTALPYAGELTTIEE